MDTYFAPAARADAAEFQRDLDYVSQNSIITGLLKAAGGLLAVLNEHRQILAVNDSYLKMLGIDNAESVLGLRPGETIQCVHAQDMPGGCGTGKFCSTCGAAISIVASLANEEPVERKCIITTRRNSKTEDLCLKVRSCLITFAEHQFILLFLQDNTALQRWTTIERMFFHDISNLITGLIGTSVQMKRKDGAELRESSTIIHQLTSRLLQEVKIQKTLLHEDLSEYQVSHYDIPLNHVIDGIRNMFSNHPAAKNKTLRLPDPVSDGQIKTDPFLLSRILDNMIMNALESTDAGGEVRFWIEEYDHALQFCVWNQKAIPENAALRIFQRYFSTKSESGRGLGTYVMRVFGEHFLGGKVDFTTSETEGTTFRFHLPR